MHSSTSLLTPQRPCASGGSVQFPSQAAQHASHSRKLSWPCLVLLASLADLVPPPPMTVKTGKAWPRPSCSMLCAQALCAPWHLADPRNWLGWRARPAGPVLCLLLSRHWGPSLGMGAPPSPWPLGEAPAWLLVTGTLWILA